MSAKSPNSVNTDGSKPAPAPAAALTPAWPKRSYRLRFSGVGEHGVRLGRFLELLLGRLVARIAIRVVLHRQLAVGALQLGLGRGPARRRGLRSSRACSRLRHLHHRGTQQPVAEHVAAPQLADDFALAVLRARLRATTAWCTFGSKSAPSASIGRTPCLRSRSCSFAWISSTPLRYAAASSPASTVSARSKSSTTSSSSQQQVDDRLVGLLAPLALDALAVVVELRRLAQQPIVEVVALALERGELRRPASAIVRRIGRIRSRPARPPVRSRCFVSHVRA